ncbi:MAG: class I SAM-dependent methyltransferase [Thermoguttaceae bacterium]|nr:class I SAM-dependent methyltransferase [Thermoguttaceae bacterium]MDW8038593.1 CmcI family methyltransferase [Thermoguttaceae bacterium]
MWWGYLIGTALVLAGEEMKEKASRQSVAKADLVQIERVIERVDRQCREQGIPMIGPQKARRLAELVREKKPELVVEAGTAIGYSGLWIARELKLLGRGKLITIEIDPQSAKEAEANFRQAGLADVVEVRIGDARKICKEIQSPVDFLFLDCGYSNYMPCLKAIESRLRPGAVIVADNAGIGVSGMADYLKYVRQKFQSRTEWFDLDLPWAKRDAMEISIVPEK